MLRGIRTASTNWLGRTVMGVVMGLLAASFAIWGINDIFKGFGRSSLAKIGGTEIAVEQFRRAYQDQLQQLSQSGQAITPEQAKAIGLDRSVLRGLINDAGLDQIAHQMRLGVPNEDIVHRITENPLFRNPGGQFDRNRFEAFLRATGFSEQRLVAEQRQLMLRRQIIESINSDMPVPKGWLETVSEFQNQQRSIEYVTLGAAQAGEIPAATPEQLSKYFDERKILFRAPEYRKIEVIAATPEELGRWMEIPEADIKAEFDEHRNRYVTPERRHVEQIVFPTMQEAEAAAARLKDGMSFAALAAERGLKDKDIDLGSVSKSEIVDPAVANAAFALKDGEVSTPVQGRFGAVIVSVSRIEPEVGKSLAERDLAPTALKIIEKATASNCAIILPVDATVAFHFAANSPSHAYGLDAIPPEGMILDVGPQSSARIQAAIDDAATLVWNGPLGAFEMTPFDRGTVLAARHAAERTKAKKLISVAGGGDTVAALNQAGVAADFTYVSTAGGAFLEWMEGKPLPGVEVLRLR